MAAKLYIVLLELQRQTGRDTNLLLDQVGTCDHLCHRVFHLQAGIHLHEIIAILLIQKKFERTRIAIANLFYRPDGLGTNFLA